jgi:large subunit ribosomal protein L19
VSITITHKETSFGVGDMVRVSLKIKEGEKTRIQVFEGMAIALKNREGGKTLTVRRIGTGNIGVERIFPLSSPFLEKIEVVRKGTPGVKHAKIYYVREKSPREVDEIFANAVRRLEGIPQKKAKRVRRKASK